jgi:aryl-alcohol dehydrogenase-like predicted oxidoreductase
VESGVLPWCRKYGLAFLAYSPLARGILAGKKYRPNQPVPKGSLVEEMGAHTEPWYPEALRVMERLESHSQAKECSLSQFSLAWVAAQESVIPIMGARTIEQIDDNLGALEVEITAEDLALVDELSPIGVLG